MEQVVVFLILAAAVGLTVLNATRMRGFEKTYRYDDMFSGTTYQTSLRFPNSEAKIDCNAGSDHLALHLLKAPNKSGSMFRIIGQRSVFKYNLRIPWRDIQYRSARVLGRRCVWFDIPSQNTSFYLSADVGQRLLADSGQARPRCCTIS